MSDDWPRIEHMLAAQQRAADSRYASQQEALARLRDDYDKRFEAVNEFRNQLSDQAQRFMPRAEFEAQHKALIERIERSRDQSVAVILASISMVISLGGVIVLLVTHR